MTACFSAARQWRCHMSPVFWRAGPFLSWATSWSSRLGLGPGAGAAARLRLLPGVGLRLWCCRCASGLVTVVVAGAAAAEGSF